MKSTHGGGRKMTELKNRRLKWSIGRTISMGKGTFEFTRLDISEEADIPDDVDVEHGYYSLIKDVVKQMAVAETAIRGGESPLTLPYEEAVLYDEEAEDV
jgi:hypothetical protein